MEPEPVAGGPPTPAPQPPPNPWKWAALILAAAVVLLAAGMLLPQPTGSPAGPAPVLTTAATPATTTTVSTTTAGTARPTPRRTPSPETPGPDETTTAEMTQPPTPADTTPSPACIPAGAPGFTVSVSPVHATAARGETVTYRMTIDAQNCFAEPIHMELVASVLFLSQTYDLGTQEPPYPRTFEYPFKVPETLPPGVMVNGVIRSTGGGITRENQLSLTVQ
jgi:hypothetical protein